jgi:hypothetical protein
VADQQYVGRRGIAVLRVLLLGVGAVGLVLGVAFWLSGFTAVGGPVTVPVGLSPSGGTTEPDQVAVSVDGLPSGAQVWAPASELRLTAEGSTAAEQALARADELLAGIGVALAAWLLLPVLSDIAARRPFDPGRSGRVAGVAVVVLGVGLLGPLLPAWASALVIGRLGLDSPVTWAATLPLAPVLVAGLVMVVAEAFRQGERLSRDVEGLV